MSDVAIIGGGLPGLAAARTLRNAGVRCTLFEASDQLGGRARSQHFGDITVDNGFQLLNSWYPSLKELLSNGEYAALNQCNFESGFQTHTSQGQVFIGDPVRTPRLLGELLSKNSRSAMSFRDIMGLRKWFGSELSHRSSLEMRKISEKRRAKDSKVCESLDKSGVTRQMRTAAADPAMRAFLLDTDGETSAITAKWVFATLLRGAPTVPAQGMGDVANLLGRNTGVITETNARVTALKTNPGNSTESAGVTLHFGEHDRTETFRYVVLALPQKMEAELLDRPVLPARGMETFWFVSDEPIGKRPVITVDGTGRTPVASVAELTAAAPSYAPGRHLIQGTVAFGGSQRALQPGAIPNEVEMRRYMGEILDVPTSGWELVTRQRITDVFPVLTPERAAQSAKEDLVVDGGVILAGAQHATPSIDGALRSGQRAAQKVIELVGS